MPFIETLAQQMAGQTAGNVLGLALNPIAQNQQYSQSKRLQQLQIAGSKEMTDYNMMKQLEMWKATSYGAQIEQMKSAGLNPAMIYGMSGGGGTTTGSPGAGVSGQAAAQIGMGIQMGNMALIEAQRKNIEADTELKLASKPKTEEETKNIAAQTALKNVETELQKLQLAFNRQTFDARIEEIDRTIEKIVQEARSLDQNTGITAEVRKATVDKMYAEAIGATLDNAIKVAQREGILKGIEVSNAEMSKWKQELANATTALDIQQKEMLIKAFEAEVRAKSPGLWNAIGGTIQRVVNALDKGDKKELTMPSMPNLK